MSGKETYSEGDSIACPHPECGKTWSDLWDYGWGSREELETNCPHCGNPILLSCDVSVDYRCAVRP